MPKKKRIPLRAGPMTPELLPIPTEEERASEAYYPMAPNGGWTKEPIPDGFWDELADLLDRWGGVDGDMRSRLQAVIIDRTMYEAFHFEPQPRYDDESLDSLLDALRLGMMNLAIANEAVERITKMIDYLRRNKK